MKKWLCSIKAVYYYVLVRARELREEEQDYVRNRAILGAQGKENKVQVFFT